MGFWQRLIGSESEQDRDSQEFLHELAACYRQEQSLARQLRDHAERAPHQAGADQLEAVAADQDQITQALQEALIARSQEVGEAGTDAQPPKGGPNHWARVVHDLEDNQALMKRYGEQVAYWDPALPDAVALFRSLEQGKSRLGALLRDIALRADSHAID